MPRAKRRDAPGYERKLILLACAVAVPALFALIIEVLLSPAAWDTRVSILAAVVSVTLILIYALHHRATYPLRTLANLLAALREEDYSIRAREAHADDALGEVMIEVNELSRLLRERRLGALEAAALLRMVISEIDVAIFTFDSDSRLLLVNRAGERLLAEPAERLLGRHADQLGLLPCLENHDPRAIEMSFPGATGRWGVRKSTFREKGHPHTLLVITDLSQALRDEERQAWQRLVRVLSHELNNSLAPIRSIAGSLISLGSREPLPPDWTEDVRKGLAVIAARSEALTRFMEAYARLARLPRPRFGSVDVGALVERVAQLERRMAVAVRPGPPLIIEADGDQLEQAIINLVRNAVDATLESGGSVELTWSTHSGALEIAVVDEGPGLGGTANLFVPFFTTKPGGTGIGLALGRQIADAHGGSLTLENRLDRLGCVARLRIPPRRAAQRPELPSRDSAKG